MAVKWTKEMIEDFINKVQQHECLYNTRCAEYLDRTKKAVILNGILCEMQTVCPTLTIVDLKKKWKGIRTQYLQEIRQMEASKRSGIGSDEVYRPKLWCFDQLQFLRSHSIIRQSTSNVEVNCDESENFDIMSSPPSLPPTPPQPKKHKPTAQTILKGIDNVTQLVLNKNKNKKYDWLGRLVTSEMEKIKNEDQDDAAWEIQCVIRRYIRRSQLLSASDNSSRDILELSMDGVFEESDFVTNVG